MASVLRVIPNEIYDMLVKEGILETKLLQRRLDSHSINEGIITPSPTVNSDSTEQLGGGKKMKKEKSDCNWINFDDRFKLVS